MPVARVYVVKYGDRKDLALRFKCPITKKQYQRTAATPDQALAAEAAEEWEDELNEGGYLPPVAVPWQTFLADFETNHLQDVEPIDRAATLEALGKFGSLVEVENLTDVSKHHVDYFRRRLRASGEPLDSIGPTLGRVLHAFQWAERERLIKRAPTLDVALA